MRLNKCRIGDYIKDVASGPFGSNLKVECFVPSGFPIIDGANLTGVRVTDNITKFVTEAKARSLSRSIAKRHDVIVTISGTLGQISYIPNDSKHEEYLCSQRQFRVTFDESKVCVEYLVNLLRTPYGQRKILAFANYVGVPALAQPIPNFKNIEVYLPDLPTQLRIAGVLGSIDEKIELNRKKIAELETLAKTIYDYWFVQFDFPDKNGKPYKSSGGKMVWNEHLKREVPEGWETCPLRDLLDARVQPSIPITATVPYVTTENLMPNMGGYQREERCASSIIGGHPFSRNDTLVSNIRPYFQKLWYADAYGIASSDVIRFHAKECPSLLFYALARADFFAYVMKGAKGSKMPRGDKAHIARYVLSWGNDSVRNKSVALFQPILEQCNLLVNEIASLERQRDTLLPLLMNGQVVVG